MKTVLSLSLLSLIIMTGCYKATVQAGNCPPSTASVSCSLPKSCFDQAANICQGEWVAKAESNMPFPAIIEDGEHHYHMLFACVGR